MKPWLQQRLGLAERRLCVDTAALFVLYLHLLLYLLAVYLGKGPYNPRHWCYIVGIKHEQ
jgi:hypothetical protein